MHLFLVFSNEFCNFNNRITLSTIHNILIFFITNIDKVKYISQIQFHKK